MDRKNRILNHDLFIKCMRKIEAAEKGRIFCRHNIAHFLDVARLAVILNLKEKLQVDEELIYAAALLHDIGRFRQYEDGTPHEEASALLAPQILRESGFHPNETDVIIEAVLLHRSGSAADRPDLTGLLYRADKMSRSCFACGAKEACDKEQERKNGQLVF